MSRLSLSIGAVVVFGLLPSSTGVGAARAIDPVIVDAVALDDRGVPVEGLASADFRIREDGLPVPIDSVEEVGGGGRAAERTIVLLLDDTGTRTQLTPTVQKIARSVVNRAAPGDRVNVLRLNRRGDEAIGDRALALSRIGDYAAGMIPFFGRETLENVLGKVRDLSRGFGRDDAALRRRTILAIGSPAIFDLREPFEGKASLIWDEWVQALAESSRALVNVSVIDPAGLTGRVKLMGARGLVERTGGDSRYNSSAFDAAVADIWRDAGHYYLIRYTPRPGNRELHELTVTALRRGVHVRARKARG